MNYGCLFSGVGCSTLAFAAFGWTCAFHAETDPFASAVLRHHWPEVPNIGDVTTVDWSQWRSKVDLLMGSPPCQDFSIAGKRAGVSGTRGNLSMTWAEVVNATDPLWSITENVPGWLTSRDNAFGAFVGALVGGGAAWSRQGVNGEMRVLSLDPRELPRGECLTLHVSACPSDGGVCLSLPDVLEQWPIPSRYFLSAKACAGILRRAERRGKKLPGHLVEALVNGAGATTLTDTPKVATQRRTTT